MLASDMDVRPAQPDDVDVLCDFQVAMAWESESLRLDPATVHRGIADFLSRPDDGTYYVMSMDQQRVGCAMVQHEWSDWRAKTVLWLHSVYVTPDFRQRGCFRQFYRFLQGKVQDDPGLAGIRLYVDKNNQRAESAYRNIGMTDEHYKLFEWLK